MTSSPQSAEHGASYPLFDWLRFVLASTVALFHAHVITWGPSSNLAVQVFFALSGWLIGGILLRTNRDDLPRFYYNRVTRIWAPYLLAVAAVYLLSAARDPINAHYFQFLFYDLTFTHNWFIPKTPDVIASMPLHGTGAHFWSIAVEEQFYLVAPLLVTLTPWGRRVKTWAVLSLAAYLQQGWYASISLGVLAAVAHKEYGSWHLGPRARTALAGALAASTLAFVFVPSGYQLSSPVFAITVVLLTAIQSARGGLGTFLGGMSYPLYLNHWAGIFAANYLAKRLGITSQTIIGLISYAVALAICSAAYIAVDKQIQAYRSRYFTEARGKACAAVAYALMTIGVIGGLLLPSP